MYALTHNHLNIYPYNKNIIGRGRSTIVLEHSPETVRIVTRDKYKVLWYQTAYGSECESIIYVDNKKDPFYEFPIYNIVVPKFYPLLANEIEYFKRNLFIPTKRILLNRKDTSILEQNTKISKIIKQSDGIVHKDLYYHFVEKHGESLILDINSTNIMADEKGYHLTDTFFPIELLKIFLPCYYERLIKKHTA